MDGPITYFGPKKLFRHKILLQIYLYSNYASIICVLQIFYGANRSSEGARWLRPAVGWPLSASIKKLI